MKMKMKGVGVGVQNRRKQSRRKRGCWLARGSLAGSAWLAGRRIAIEAGSKEKEREGGHNDGEKWICRRSVDGMCACTYALWCIQFQSWPRFWPKDGVADNFNGLGGKVRGV
jgi:hypothetical protein